MVGLILSAGSRKPRAFINAEPGDGQVTLSWRPVAVADAAGYIIYYGKSSGNYTGVNSNLGDSPIDVGSTTEVTLEGLENGTLYYFTVVTYDSASLNHLSTFSKEVIARPSRLGRK